MPLFVVLKDTNSRTLTIQRFGSETVLSFALFCHKNRVFNDCSTAKKNHIFKVVDFVPSVDTFAKNFIWCK